MHATTRSFVPQVASVVPVQGKVKAQSAESSLAAMAVGTAGERSALGLLPVEAEEPAAIPATVETVAARGGGFQPRLVAQALGNPPSTRCTLSFLVF